MAGTPRKPRVVIAGGGVVGTATAYYLARDHGVGATVVDRVGVAAAASGNAGGFLARHWNDGAATEALTHASFDLHEALATELKETVGAEVDYRRLRCEAVAVGTPSASRPPNAKLKNVEWVAPDAVFGHQSMGGPEGIAQVHPRKLTEAMMRAASTLAGAEFRLGTVRGVATREDDDKSKTVATGLVVDDDASIIEADAVVLAMGPWTHVAGLPSTASHCGLSGFSLSLPPVVGTKYHAVLLQSPKVLSQAVFFQGRGDVEVYPRPDGEVYCTAFPESSKIVDDLPGETEVRDDVCQRLIDAVTDLGDENLKNAPVTRKQACHLPSVAGTGSPLIGNIPNLDRGFVAVGHGCWGILLAPATGRSLADLIARDLAQNAQAGVAASPTSAERGNREGLVDLRPFDPVASVS